MKFIILVAVFNLIFLAPVSVVEAQESGAGGFVTCSGTDCSACNLVEMANTGIVWLFGAALFLFTFLMVVAGFGLVTSGGNPSALEDAKSKFKNLFIGLAIIMSAWLIVNTIMVTLVKGNGVIEGYGPWTEVKCQTQTVPKTPPPPPPGGTGGVVVVDPVPVDPNNLPDGQFTYQPGIAGQRAHASSKLEATLNCMAGKVPGNVGQISSISDGLILNGQKTWDQCRQRPQQCSHVPSSYHYGNNGTCGNKSYAVDFGDEQNATVLCNAARSCGQIRDCSVHNGNHVHMEVIVSPC